jgi:mannose-P-dolichol utilization defect 1
MKDHVGNTSAINNENSNNITTLPNDKIIQKKQKSQIAIILGYVVIFFSIVYKIPQIIQIQNVGSARGVNLLTNLQDLAAYIFAFAYSHSEGHPFSAYGENLFQGIGTLIISSQIFYFERKRSLSYVSQFIFGIGVSGVIMSKSKEIFGRALGTQLLNLSKTVTIILGLTGKLPQVYSNFRAKAVGELSFVTTLLNFIGSLVRIYTVFKQLAGDALMITTQSTSLLVNGTLVLQILYYGPNGRK